MKVFTGLVLVSVLISCNPLRHYQKVVNDPFRNVAERSLLARASVQEFPAVQDTPRVIFSGVDSSDYLAVAEAYNQLIDTLVYYAEKDTVLATTPTKGGYTVVDSLKIVRSTLRNYHPPAVIKTQIKEIKVTDVAAISLKQAEVNACRFENESLQRQLVSATNDVKAAKARQGWYLFWIVVAAIVGVIGSKLLWR